MKSFFRRFKNPLIVGELEKIAPTANPATTLVSLRSYMPDDSARDTVVVAFPTDGARQMQLRETFLAVCSPVNIRKDPDQRSGIFILPLPTEKPPLPKAA